MIIPENIKSFVKITIKKEKCKMRRSKDIITKKEQELKELQASSEAALDIVTSTIKNLDDVNEKIDEKISEIHEMREKLDKTETSLVETKTRNDRISSKFRALIEE